MWNKKNGRGGVSPRPLLRNGSQIPVGLVGPVGLVDLIGLR